MSPSPENINRLLDEAAEAFGAGKFNLALDFLRKVLDQDPAHFDALHISGVLEYQEGNHQRAIELIQKALEINPGFAEAHYNLGKVLQAEEQFSQAAVAYGRAIELNPSLDPAWFNLGLVETALHHPDQAVAAFHRAVEIDPQDTTYAFNLGTGLMHLKDWNGAGHQFERVVQTRPEDYQAWNNLGIVLKELGDAEAAQSAYQHALEIQPDFADAHFNLGNLHEHQGELDSALHCYQQSLALEPGFAKACNNMGNVHYLLKQFEQARAAYERTLELDPGNESARHMLDALNGVTTATAPPDYIRRLFDRAAPDFEDRLVDALAYRSPQELRSLLDKLSGPELRLNDAVDLGCGTGLSGRVFRDRVDRIAGVDLSPNMIEEARKKQVYDRLETGDLIAFLENSGDRYSLFLATDVLVYLGDLRPLFDAIGKRTAGDAWFLFSVERSDDEDFILRPTGRFGHSRVYIESLAREYGWDIAALEETVVRTENDNPIPGYNVVLRRNDG